MNYKNATVLILDENPCMRKVLGNIVSKDFGVVTKKSSLEAFAWLQAGEKPDSIILGLSNDHNENQHFLHQIKATGYFNDIPVIVLSENAEEKTKTEFINSGAHAFFPKPFKPADLIEEINSSLPSETIMMRRSTKAPFSSEKVYSFIPKIRELLTGAMLYLFNQL